MLSCANWQRSRSFRLTRLGLHAVATKSSLLSGLAAEQLPSDDSLEKATVKDKRFIDKARPSQRHHTERLDMHPAYEGVTDVRGQVRILATGGQGGAGCESHINRSRKGTFRPIPDGGHGGQGGDVYVEACSS